MKKAVILGVGPEAGLGSQLALRFAREGMHVLAASWTPSALEKLVAKIRESGGEATAVPTDATNEEQVISLFENSGADLEVAVYNAGNNLFFISRISWECGCFSSGFPDFGNQVFQGRWGPACGQNMHPFPSET